MSQGKEQVRGPLPDLSSASCHIAGDCAKARRPLLCQGHTSTLLPGKQAEPPHDPLGVELIQKGKGTQECERIAHETSPESSTKAPARMQTHGDPCPRREALACMHTQFGFAHLFLASRTTFWTNVVGESVAFVSCTAGRWTVPA